MNYPESISQLFTYFHYKIYRSSGFKMDLSRGNQGKYVDNFVEMLTTHYDESAVSPDFLIEYFLFQFAQKHDWDSDMKIQLNWIIGKKAFETWLNRNVETYSHFINKFTLEYDVNVHELKMLLYHVDVKSQGLDPVEEMEKVRFSGVARLGNCMENTTLYNHRSETCITCQEKFECKKILKSINKKLYDKRGYSGKCEKVRN